MATSREFPPIGEPKIIVGFSGGNDSLAFALLLARTQAITGIDPLLVHVDHGLRPNSKAQAKEAEALAQEIGLRFVNVALKRDLVKRHPGVGMEEAARRERYASLAKYADRSSTDVIALAHHSRDQAETVLLHMLRGSGISGMGAMEQQSALSVPWWGSGSSKCYKLWRPLLEESREELERYVAASGLVPVEDESNQDQTFRRNAIRHQILPALESIQPGAIKSICRFSLIASQEDLLINELVSATFYEIQHSNIRYDRGRLAVAPSGIRRRLLHLAAGTSGVLDMTFERVEQLSELVGNPLSDSTIQLKDGSIAVTDEEWLYIGKPAGVWEEIADVHDLLLAPLNWTSKTELPIELDRRVSKVGLAVHAATSTAAFGKRAAEWHTVIPKSAFERQMILRMLVPGDRWARSRIPMREWLRVDGVPPIARRRVIVVASEEGVWWAPTIERPARDAPVEGEPVIYLDIQKSDQESEIGDD